MGTKTLRSVVMGKRHFTCRLARRSIGLPSVEMANDMVNVLEFGEVCVNNVLVGNEKNADVPLAHIARNKKAGP